MKRPKIVVLPTKTIARHAGVMSTLQNMSDAAQRPGQPMIGLAMVGVLADGTCVTAYEPGENANTLVGGLEFLKFRIMRGIENG